MRTIKQVNIKNRQNYFFNDMTNITDFDLSLLNVDSLRFRDDDLIIYDIKYIKNLSGLNSLYLVFNNLHAYIEKSSENKYLIFASTDKNKMVLGDYTENWNDIKEQIKSISGNKVIKYSKDFMKTKFESDDDLPISKIINISVCVIIIRGVFQENNKYYPQVLLHDCFYEHEEDINPLLVNLHCIVHLLRSFFISSILITVQSKFILFIPLINGNKTIKY